MDHGAHTGHGNHGHGDHNEMAHGDHGNVASAAVAAVTSTVASVLSDLQTDYTGHNIHSYHAQQTGNHGSMDHASMDHSSMDHGSMSHDTGHDSPDHSNMGHSMKMWFHTGYTEIILFESWSINSVGGLIGSMIGIFFMAALYEGLKYYREYLFWRTFNALQYRSVTLPAEKGVVAEDNQIVHMIGGVTHNQPPTMFSWMHGFQTVLHIIQMVLSYFLMLIFMTYNVWLCTAVVLGAAVGYFLFGWKKPVVVDVTEHCH